MSGLGNIKQLDYDSNFSNLKYNLSAARQSEMRDYDGPGSASPVKLVKSNKMRNYDT